MNTELVDLLPYRLGIPSMSLGKTIKPGGDQCTGALVLEARSPLAKCLGLFELEHMKCSFKTTRCQSPSEQCSKRCP